MNTKVITKVGYDEDTYDLKKYSCLFKSLDKKS